MINFIIGEIVLKTENSIVLETNGIGYEIFVSSTTLSSLPSVSSTAKIFAFLHVKEDGICLYGFASQEEKDLFLKLIEVSGVGPKVALSILSGIRLSDLCVAIKTGDIKILSTIKGLGRKTAERIVLELKDKISVVGFENQQNEVSSIDENIIDEATEALIALGVNKNEAYRLARENSKGSENAEDIIRKTFQNFN